MKRGYFTLLVLVYSAVFLTLVSALSGYIFVEKRLELAKENREKAFHIAEAGLEYYRWHLAHWPNDLKDGTGQSGPYQHSINDPEGGVMGNYSLDISGGVLCGQVTSVSITSTGWTTADPTYKRILYAKYTRPSVAEYSTIVNSNVWAGADRVINGPYHSNGGVRMDGTHNADVTSGVSTWSCTSTFGCSPSATKNGVFGAGGPSNLWSFPAPAIDFNGISVDLTKLKGYATSSGRYFAASGNYGYRIVFKDNATIDVYRVTGTTQVWGYTTEYRWRQERPVISASTFVGNYTIPESCPVVFVEDNAWIEGVVKGKVTFAAADVGTGSVDRSIILNNSLTYASTTGDGLTAIGEQDVLVGLQTPDLMSVNGIYIAQKGKFGRNHYCQSECDSSNGSNEGLPSSLDSYVTRSTLNTNGTVVSNGRIGTKWTSGNSFISGYSQRNDSYDRTLASDPPAFTPATSDDYKFVEWRDLK